ncbi:hypothetical protein [Sphingobacterium sp.]|uniref:alpha/beta hydrolase family protein n=1 Tax=Sphingobacterium sp. TaxID=341027 RepID=UPI0031DEDEC8
MKRFVIFFLSILLFVAVFGISATYTTLQILGVGGKNVFTLQGSSNSEPLQRDEYKKEVIAVRYINKNKQIDSRQIILYRPLNKKGNIPLIYVPHYSVEEESEDFKTYIRNGWAVSSPYLFESKQNAALVTDGLVFNNAALYTLRNYPGVDKQRIAIVGGSAGGYTTLMLSQLQMGTSASIANSPISNVYFNLHIHFMRCDSINHHAGIFNFPIPIQGMISKLFRPINDNFKNEKDPMWEATSPVSMARQFSNPTVINHNTGDILVPIDQITKKYAYKNNDGTLPKGFNGRMEKNYPGLLSCSLEDLADPNEIFIKKYTFKNNNIVGEMPFSRKILTINVIDDGPISGKSSHAAPSTTGSFNTIPFLKTMFAQTLKETEQLVPEKLLLLLDRYQGKSKQLPAHSGVDDTVYGSFAIYQKEIIDELSNYIYNHSLDELNMAMNAAIAKSTNDSDCKIKHLATWREIRKSLRF